jgi:hypothetical protein
VISTSNQVKCITGHHGKARPQVTDGGDGLQVWKVAANISNKKSEKLTRGGSAD